MIFIQRLLPRNIQEIQYPFRRKCRYFLINSFRVVFNDSSRDFSTKSTQNFFCYSFRDSCRTSGALSMLLGYITTLIGRLQTWPARISLLRFCSHVNAGPTTNRHDDRSIGDLNGLYFVPAGTHIYKP